MKHVFCMIGFHDLIKVGEIPLPNGRGYKQFLSCTRCSKKEEHVYNPNAVTYCPCCERRDEDCRCGAC